MKEMNSPSITENKMELKNYTNDLTNENKSTQEVNNNLTSVQNNNQPSQQPPQQQSININNNNSINEQQQSNQFIIKQENVLNSPSSSSNLNLNNSSSNIHTNSNQNNQQQSNYTFEYWSQLMKDSKQLQSFSNIFMHVERLLEEEISRVRKALFQNNKFENQPLILPEPEGSIIQKQEKVYVPIHEHPNYNFVGRILGPRGMTAKQLEQETGCKIMIRGKGSMRNKHMEEQNRGKPNWEHLSDDLHVLIIVEDTENRAKLKIERAVEEVKKLLVPVTEGEDELKKKQLMELAIINGTYKDSNTRLLENEQLKLLPQASQHHALAVSQQNLTHLNHLPLTPQLHHSVLRQASLGNSHASNQSATAVSMIANSGHTGSHNASVQSGHPSTSIGGPLMMAPRTVNTHPLLLGSNDSSTQQALAAAAAYLYPPHYDLGYAAQTINAQLTSASGFIEYPMASMAQVDAATDSARRNGECSPKSSPRAARSPLVQGSNRQDTTGTLKTTISLGKTPSILNSGPFYLMKEPLVESELTGSANLIQHYNLEHSYNKFCCGKRMKDQLSAFLPNLPGVSADTPGNVDNSSLRSLIEKPPIIGKELLPLTQNQLAGFRLHPGPIPEQYRLMAQPSLKKKHKQKKSKHRTSEISNFESQGVEASNGDLASAHEKKHKKQRKHDDEKERKKKKKDKKKKKQKQVEHGASSLPNITNPLLL